MARRSGLGRGLGALIPTEVANDTGSSLIEVPVGEVSPNRHQPRQHFDEEALASLSASIRELGVLQPILVRAREDGTYELIAGERRWRAAKRAGLRTIPAVVRTATDVSSLEQALVENLHRSDLNALEEAAAFQQLIEDFNLTHDEVATRVGKSRSAVSNALRLFQLPPTIQRLVVEGRLSAGHARALLGTPDRGFQEALAKRAAADGLSVRDVEDAVRDRNELAGQVSSAPGKASGSAGASPQLRPPGLLELEELLASYLDTRVKVELGQRKGRIVIDFATLEDLERIYRVMTEHKQPAQPAHASPTDEA
ncbi:MAG TPA: ParB/RepB/Spo0J family partition protein [Acidimicrobiales bacterium]|nr:ParB/RepB/Spo0J family partition protein [Acidimicrobiales bacterium]